MFSGATYQQFWVAGTVAAQTFNAKRQKRSDKWFTFKDFHPYHMGDKRLGLSGKQVLAKTVSWFPAGQVKWAPGYGPDSIVGGNNGEQQSN
jgi:hypothetical protein